MNYTTEFKSIRAEVSPGTVTVRSGLDQRCSVTR
jgi:hypothetical protein